MININLEKKKIKHRNGEKRYILLFKGIIIEITFFFRTQIHIKMGNTLPWALVQYIKWFVYEIGNNKLGLQQNLEIDH